MPQLPSFPKGNASLDDAILKVIMEDIKTTFDAKINQHLIHTEPVPYGCKLTFQEYNFMLNYIKDRGLTDTYSTLSKIVKDPGVTTNDALWKSMVKNDMTYNVAKHIVENVVFYQSKVHGGEEYKIRTNFFILTPEEMHTLIK